ncbi:MAG: hypothetical protein AAF810_20060 [Cyanobacteria bacterium P01_D01_bin.36]
MKTVLESPSPAQPNSKRHLKINEVTYKSNLESDYTEKISELDKRFRYEDEQHHYWGTPELSLFYGSALYEEASDEQKKALNHLFWATQYDHVSASETSTTFYNTITAGVFENVGGYETLCKSLHLETSQEKYHIHAFKAVSFKTKRALIKDFLTKPASEFFVNAPKPSPKKRKQTGNTRLSPEKAKFKTFRFLTKQLVKAQGHQYSALLQKVDKAEHIPTMQQGYIGEALPRTVLEYITYNWGTSPFLACQHFIWRYMGNAHLKLWEYYYVKYYRTLQKQGAALPAPTQISYFHLMDESFHTTTSQLIARDMYRDFAAPSLYEKQIANWIMYFMQRGILSEFSAAIPSMYRSDVELYPFYYRILRSSIFDLSADEALNWMEKIFCQEHEGMHLNLKMHRALLTDLKRMVSKIDYLWPVNRDYRLMAEGANIDKAISANTVGLRRFRQTVIR